MSSRSLCTATAAAIAALAAAAPAHAQAWEQERVGAIMMIANGAPDAAASGLPLVEERLQVAIDGQHATTTLLQAYVNQTGGTVEGRYALHAGSAAHVEGFAYWNGEAKIVGEVFERDTARRVYDNVTQRRRDPGLLEQVGDGAFAFKVFPIAPRERKRIELRWTRWLERRGRSVRYHAPIGRPDTGVVVELRGAIKNVRSPTHVLHTEWLAGGGARLRADALRAGAQDLAIEWDVDEPDWNVAAYAHPNGALDGWFALALAAPDLGAGAVTAKDVTLVIDRSGSMTGVPMEHAQAAAVDMIRRLDPADRINVIAFSDEVDPLFRAPQPLTAENRGRAIDFVAKLTPGGGTDLALALGTAITAQDLAPGRPRVVVFMTDGVSDADRTRAAARTDTGDVRLFTVGFGPDVNRHLLARLAAMKRGRFVAIANPDEIRPEVGRLAAQIAKPLLVDVAIDVEGPQGLKLYPRTLPDLFARDELMVTGRLRGTGVVKFTIRGKLAGKPVAFARTVDLASAPPRPWVGRLWAQARVAHLLEEIALGASQPEYVQEATELALAYNFVTPYTAFLAIPESELGAERWTVEQARARKQRIVASNPDVMQLQRGSTIAASLDTTIEIQGKAPTISRSYTTSMPPPARTVADSNDPDASEDSGSHAKVRSRGRGCAGCATGDGAGDGGATGLAALALALGAVLARRRRAT